MSFGENMRKLVILRGAQGVGKSSFIKEHNLEIYTLSTDQIRLMISSPELTTTYTETIPQYINHKVWNLLFFLLEERMKKDEFTIIDAVHADSNDFTNYKKLAEKYRYRIYIIDFTDVPKEQVYEQNKNRENYKVVPQESIDKAYQKFANTTPPSSFKIIKPHEFSSLITNHPKNYDNYQNIHIIGDIHGCCTTLKKYFDEYPLNPNDAYIFLGDYFDRGIENFQTFTFLNELSVHKNIIFLIGNHEDKLYKYACDDEFKMDYAIKKTITEFNENNVSKSSLRGFIKRLSQIAYITFRNKTYLITHGGIPYFSDKPLDFYSTNSFIYGIDKYEINIDQIYNDYTEKQTNKTIQIHGHRNYDKIPFNQYPYSYNLDGDIEHGGSLRILTLLDNGEISYLEIKNNIYNENFNEENKVYDLIHELRSNHHIYEKELGNSISSFNFTKEAFYNHRWDNLTTRARGLFINTTTNKIIARSYDKFFNIDEQAHTSFNSIQDTYAYPIKLYLKYNGFLGLLSIVNGELYFTSKSTNTGDYVDYFKNIFYKIYNEKQIEAITNKIITDNVTFVFEVIDPINDPHIIKYEQENLILLDIIKNSLTFNTLTYDELKTFGNNNNIQIKELIYIAQDKDEFMEIITNISEPNYQLNNHYIKGFVITDNNLNMVKWKSLYYKEWKYLRNRMEYAIKNNKYNLKYKDELEHKFITHIENKYANKNIDIKDINIIDERDDFLNS